MTSTLLIAVFPHRTLPGEDSACVNGPQKNAVVVNQPKWARFQFLKEPVSCTPDNIALPDGRQSCYKIHTVIFMIAMRNAAESDCDKLGRIGVLSWLSHSEIALLTKALVWVNFVPHELILQGAAFASEAHIQLSGVSRITSLNSRGERVTVSFVAPGPIPEFPSVPLSRFAFQCEAFNNCRVGSLSWKNFDAITINSPESAVRKFHEQDLRQWYRLLLRSSSFLNLALHERIALTLLELSSEFGVEESRGTLLRVAFSHKDIAELVGASRPRVTEHLARLERDQFVLREGRRLFVQVAKLSDSMTAHAA
jgi:CRP-like cAMP-binding protein